jgi:hypothetical protein
MRRVMCLMTVLTSFTRRRLAAAQDHHYRLAALHVIDVDGHEAALVVVGVPERQLLAAVHDVERVVDVECDLGGRCWKRRAELVDQRRRQRLRPSVFTATAIITPMDTIWRANPDHAPDVRNGVTAVAQVARFT